MSPAVPPCSPGKRNICPVSSIFRLDITYHGEADSHMRSTIVRTCSWSSKKSVATDFHYCRTVCGSPPIVFDMALAEARPMKERRSVSSTRCSSAQLLFIATVQCLPPHKLSSPSLQVAWRQPTSPSQHHSAHPGETASGNCWAQLWPSVSA